MRHGVISWFMLALFLASPSLPNKQHDTPQKSPEEIEEERKALDEENRKMRRLAEEVLKGRQVLVRVYCDSKKDFRAFKLFPVELKGLYIRRSQIIKAYGKMPESAVFAVVGSDQKDELVAEVISNFMFIWTLKSYGIHIWPSLTYGERQERLTFNDALGNPIPNANAELLLGEGSEKSVRISIDLGKLDKEGRLKRPLVAGFVRRSAFMISHPDYGTVLAYPPPQTKAGERADTYTVPIVPIGTVADERTIHGFVLDTEDNPVKDVKLRCAHIMTSSRGRLSAEAYARYETITDANGYFAMYLPVSGDKQETLIPLRAVYRVDVTPPTGLGLQHTYARIKSGEESKIILQPKKEQAPSRTFVFEDEFGPITDPNLLKSIRLTYKNEKALGNLMLYDKWADRANPPIGRYIAIMGSTSKKKIFGPVEVTEDSPDVLLFKPYPHSRCRGRVIDGLTGRPIRGAFVAVGYGIEYAAGFAMITPEQWDATRSLPLNPPIDDPDLAPIVKLINDAERIVRTDEQGRFDMSLPVGDRWLKMVTFAQHYLCRKREISSIGSAAESLEDVVVKLFPAATIIIEPNVPDKAGSRVDLRLWCSSDNIHRAWLDSSTTGERDGKVFISTSTKLRSSGVQTVHVPAMVPLDFIFHFARNNKWRPIAIRDTRLEQGQTLNLGRQVFQPAMRILVKLVNSAGEPVPGVTVAHYTTGTAVWGNAPATNEQGIAELYVMPNSTGQFYVQYRGKTTSYDESMHYEVGGEKDRNRTYAFQLSDRIVSDLFK